MVRKRNKFHRRSISGAPTISFIKSVFNSWVLIWILISLVLTAVYGYFSQYGLIEEYGIVEWTGMLFWQFLLIAFLTGIIMVYIHDKTQPDNPAQRLFPIVIWGRKLLIKSGPLLRQYLFLNDQEESPFNRITRNWIYETSKGVRNTIGFGSQVDMDRVGSMIALPATFTNMSTKTGEETGKSYEKVIGKHTECEPVSMKHFINIGGMSYGALSFRAHAALNKGAEMAGIMHNTGEGSLAPCHEFGGDLIFQIGTAKYGIRDGYGNMDDDLLKKMSLHSQVKMIEIKLAQGAKPGKGGMLLKEKITEEISRIRKIPMGKDAYAPARHREFNDVNGLFDFIDKVRKITQKPVGIKMVIGHTSEIESIAFKMNQEPGRGPDYIAIDGGEGGTGAAPLVLSSYSGLPMKQAIAVADWALKRHKVRDKVIVIAGGKISTPIEVAVAMALGANAVYIARGFMLSLGCIQALECHTNHCPTGIATQNKRLEKALDIDAAAKRVASYANTLYKETQMLAESCGYSSPDQITPDDIMVVTSPGHLDYLSELHGISAFEASLERQRAKDMGLSVGEMKMWESNADSPSG